MDQKPKPIQKLTTTIKITSNGREVASLLLDQQNRVMRGCARLIRKALRKFDFGIMAVDRIVKVLILTILGRFTKEDHFFGAFEFGGRKWGFTDVEYEASQVA